MCRPSAEIGYPAAAYAFWNGVFVPVKTPQDIVAKLYHETQKAIADPVVKERLAKVGVEPLVMSQPEFAALLQGRRAGHRQARQGGGHREAVRSRNRIEPS